MNKTENYQKWRFWPIICLAFFYPVNGALVNLAIPLYYFKRGTNIEIIGFLAAGVTMTYCFSPMLLNSISKKINRRRRVILGIVGVSLAQIVFYFSLEPIPFFIARLVEGFMAGFIWSNLQSSITDNAHHNHSKYLAKYNLSWNAGVLGGYLLGAIVLYFVDNLEIIFYIAPLLVVSNAFIILFFFQSYHYIFFVFLNILLSFLVDILLSLFHTLLSSLLLLPSLSLVPFTYSLFCSFILISFHILFSSFI